MTLQYTLLDVFADKPFQGTQIPVAVIEEGQLEDARKAEIANEFSQTEMVFLEVNTNGNTVSVFNRNGRVEIGAHTILAAAYIAHEHKLDEDCGDYSRYQLNHRDEVIDCFIDKVEGDIAQIQFARTLNPVVDRFTPSRDKIAKALGVEEKHIAFSPYHPAVVSVDHPTLVVPFTRPEHVLAAHLQSELWGELQSEIYATNILLIAPGTITGGTEFHGRLINANFASGVYPPIGNVMPEFIGYLATQEGTADGTHTFAIDRGSDETRKSILKAEFDKRPGSSLKCRIGGNVIKMGTGELLHT